MNNSFNYDIEYDTYDYDYVLKNPGLYKATDGDDQGMVLLTTKKSVLVIAKHKIDDITKENTGWRHDHFRKYNGTVTLSH